MQRTHRGVALDTVFDENGTRRGIFTQQSYILPLTLHQGTGTKLGSSVSHFLYTNDIM